MALCLSCAEAVLVLYWTGCFVTLGCRTFENPIYQSAVFPAVVGCFGNSSRPSVAEEAGRLTYKWFTEQVSESWSRSFFGIVYNVSVSMLFFCCLGEGCHHHKGNMTTTIHKPLCGNLQLSLSLACVPV